MLVQVQWINYCKESELDRPELFKRIDDIYLEDTKEEKEIIQEEVKKEISEAFALSLEGIQILECHVLNN
ncbi:hypothetical protein [Thalassobacillus pellis]|uniref:hypothetical protein n=1 Tax=Thalassobacillus pellis TaxID=748008 RepID=UPI001960A4A0|nr:hypothetical protein [Thalassobacillus pellis]MBM7554841.1 hypothetical protein [Thalassobacillus pellis]